MGTSLLLLCGLVSLLWARIGWKYGQALRAILWLAPDPEAVAAGRLTAILPARNEEEGLGTSLDSLLTQPGLDLRVVVVDDHSTDRTGAIADAFALRDPRVRVLHAPLLREGWMGQQNAIQSGAEGTEGDLLLISDADVVHRRGGIAAAVAELERGGYDFLSLFPRLSFESVWESALVPLFFHRFAAGRREGIEDPASPQVAAVGAFLLVRKSAFDAIGGFEKVRQAMPPDPSFAYALKRAGFRVGFRLAPDCLEVRMFKGNRQAFWGTTKTFSAQARRSPWAPVASIAAAVVLLGVAPAVAALGAATGNPALLGAGAATWLFQAGTLLRARRLMRFSPLRLLLYPLGAVVVVCCATRALYLRHVRGSMEWRGRETPAPR